MIVETVVTREIVMVQVQVPVQVTTSLVPMEIVLNIKAGSVMETMIVETVVTREIVMVQVQIPVQTLSLRVVMEIASEVLGNVMEIMTAETVVTREIVIVQVQIPVSSRATTEGAFDTSAGCAMETMTAMMAVTSGIVMRAWHGHVRMGYRNAATATAFQARGNAMENKIADMGAMNRTALGK